MRNGNFVLEVLVHGRVVKEYPYHNVTMIEGRIGSEYVIRVKNNSGRRVVAVVSIDGLSVMKDKVASENDSGYIIEPYGSVDIPGWRLDDHDVSRFFFGTMPEAYASLRGEPRNIGVIGVAIFYERQLSPMRDLEFLGREKGVRDPDPIVTFEATSVGTGFGRKEEHEVISVYFKRESQRAASLELHYDTAEGLRRRGINVVGTHAHGTDRVVEARPFVEDEPKGEGCEPPPGWRDE